MKQPDIQLNGYNALFGADTTKRIVTLPLSELHQHPQLSVAVQEDDYLQELAESIKKNGVLEDVRAFPDPEGGYWIISGRHRCAAAKLAGLTEVSVILDDSMTQEQAEIGITDCNLRHELGVMEKAWTYRIKREAEGRQGHRSDLHGKLEREDPQESERTIQRYIRLTYLIPELQSYTERTGKRRLPVRTGAAISYLDPKDQDKIHRCIITYDLIPCQEVAECWQRRAAGPGKQYYRLRDGLIQEGFEGMLAGKNATTKPYKLTFNADKIGALLPSDYDKHDAEALILELLEKWAEEQKGARF